LRDEGQRVPEPQRSLQGCGEVFRQSVPKPPRASGRGATQMTAQPAVRNMYRTAPTTHDSEKPARKLPTIAPRPRGAGSDPA
jgi:hypothetical protein